MSLVILTTTCGFAILRLSPARYARRPRFRIAGVRRIVPPPSSGHGEVSRPIPVAGVVVKWRTHEALSCLGCPKVSTVPRLAIYLLGDHKLRSRRDWRCTRPPAPEGAVIPPYEMARARGSEHGAPPRPLVRAITRTFCGATALMTSSKTPIRVRTGAPSPCLSGPAFSGQLFNC